MIWIFFWWITALILGCFSWKGYKRMRNLVAGGYSYGDQYTDARAQMWICGILAWIVVAIICGLLSDMFTVLSHLPAPSPRP